MLRLPASLLLLLLCLRSRANAYVTLPTLSAAGSLDFKFMFKTKEKEGLLFYNDGRDNDFLAIELVNGYVHLALNDGSGSRLVQVGSAKQLNDDEWHLVSVKQSGPHNFEVGNMVARNYGPATCSIYVPSPFVAQSVSLADLFTQTQFLLKHPEAAWSYKSITGISFSISCLF